MKKIRGTRRHTRAISSLQPTPEPLPTDALAARSYQYATLGLGPWHWHGRQPPRWIRQLAVRHLLNTFFTWEKQLREQPAPHYLAIWLADTEFAHSSQVVAAIRNCVKLYQNKLGQPVPDGPFLPPEYQQLPGAEQLVWQAHRQEEWLAVDAQPAWAQQSPDYLHTTQNSKRYSVVQTGWWWVGTRFSAMPEE